MSNDKTHQGKIDALCSYLECDEDEVSGTRVDCNLFTAQGAEYLVLTDEEADRYALEYIRDSVWAFNASFIISHSDLPSEAEEMIRGFQEAKCEGANDTILALIKDFDRFARDAISADGRAHFLNTYNGEEHEQGKFFIYRTN